MGGQRWEDHILLSYARAVSLVEQGRTHTHEFGHVKFHGPLWAQKFANGDLLERGVNSNKAISKRDNILDAPQSDWMEWQAGYISGALLMPATPVRRLVSDYCSPRELHGDR